MLLALAASHLELRREEQFERDPRTRVDKGRRQIGLVQFSKLKHTAERPRQGFTKRGTSLPARGQVIGVAGQFHRAMVSDPSPSVARFERLGLLLLGPRVGAPEAVVLRELTAILGRERLPPGP